MRARYFSNRICLSDSEEILNLADVIGRIILDGVPTRVVSRDKSGSCMRLT